MKEYIERAAAIARFAFEQGNYIPEKVIDGHDNVIAVRTIKRVLREIPAEDVAPVRHGRWVRDDSGVIYCSECGEEHEWDEYRATYCDSCGARMDGEDADEQL